MKIGIADRDLNFGERAHALLIEKTTTKLTTNKTWIFECFLFLLFFGPKIGKGINDNTKDEVQDNNDDNEEEKHVIDHSGRK